MPRRRAPPCMKITADMFFADDIGAHDAAIGQGKARLGIAGAERPQRRELFSRNPAAAMVEPARPSSVNVGAKGSAAICLPMRSARKSRNAFNFIARDGETRRHFMPAAIDQQARLPRRDNMRAEIDVVHRTARALADIAFQRHDQSRMMEFFLEARGDDADHARMPVFARRRKPSAYFRSSDRFGFGQHLRLDRAAFGIQRVQMLRDLLGHARVIGRKQSRAEIGLAHAAAGIDARPQNKSRRIGIDGPLHPATFASAAMPALRRWPSRASLARRRRD